MAQVKGFFDVFTKYKPTSEKRDLLERAYSASFKYSKDPMRVEVELHFNSHEDADLIYDIENDCRELYSAESFKILPHFPPSEFNIDRFDEIAAEAALCGAVTNGFFSNADYKDDGEVITASLPFSMFGVDFVKSADTEKILENILKSRYNVDRRVKIESGSNAVEYEASWEKKRKQMLVDAEKSSREAYVREREARIKEEENRKREADPTYDFEKKAGISGVTGVNKTVSDTEFVMGSTHFVCDEAELVYGEDFNITSPMPIADVERAGSESRVYLGTVFSVESKESRNGDRVNLTIGISDGSSGIYIRKSLQTEELDWVKGVKSGANIAVYGRMMRDKFDNEPFISIRGIKKVKTKQRMDNSVEKRVELHLHSNMSQMDALITPQEIVSTAIRWGHKAIAVTDHGNVQAFPEVMLALEK